MSEDKEIEELAKKIYAAKWGDGRCFENEGRQSQIGWICAARIVREHFAKPEMGEERRQEIISKIADRMYTFEHDQIKQRRMAEDLLVSFGAIPPRPVKSLGERFAASLGYEEDGKLAAKINEAFGPVVELAKMGANCNLLAPTYPVIQKSAKEALANLEAKLGGK